MKFLLKLLGLALLKDLENSKSETLKKLLTKEKGVYKRVDEQREIMELLNNTQEGQALLEKHFYLRSWLNAQNTYLSSQLEYLKTFENENDIKIAPSVPVRNFKWAKYNAN